MQGRSNAGKTYWGNLLTCIPDIVGQTIQSSDFAYQHCVDKDIILIPELSLTKLEQDEELKKITEGLPILVNIKNKEAGKLEKTPVLLTCNRLPWASFGNESAAIKNRMIMYDNLVPSDVLKPVSEPPDPRFIVQVFDFINKNIEVKPEYPCGINNDFHKLNSELTEQFVDNLIDDGTITYPRLIADLETKTPDYYNVYCDMAKTASRSRLNCKVPLYNTAESSLHYRLLPWMKLQSDPFAMDFYWDMKDYREPILKSHLTNRKYDLMSDIDEIDYESFKKGYVNIERLLLRIRDYPDVLNMDDKQAAFKTMTKVCLRKMANTLLFILRECKAWNQSIHEVENVDQEMAFARVVGNKTSTPETASKKRKLK